MIRVVIFIVVVLVIAAAVDCVGFVPGIYGVC